MEQVNSSSGTEGGVTGNLHSQIDENFISNEAEGLDVTYLPSSPFPLATGSDDEEEPFITFSQPNHPFLSQTPPPPEPSRLSSPSSARRAQLHRRTLGAQRKKQRRGPITQATKDTRTNALWQWFYDITLKPNENPTREQLEAAAARSKKTPRFVLVCTLSS
jgi:hypothetical protein